MSLGTAIFLASLLLSLIYLYKITRDRWNWRKGANRLLKMIGFVILAGLVLWAGLWIRNRPSVRNEYAGLRLGMTMAEVKYTKGLPLGVAYVPDTPLTQESTSPDKTSATGEGKPISWDGLAVEIIPIKDLNGHKLEEYNQWYFESGNFKRIDIEFDKSGKLAAIKCYSHGFMDCPNLLGQYDGGEENQLFEALGKPSLEQIDNSSSVKTVEYKDLNAIFYLAQKKIYMLGITNHTATHETMLVPQ